MEPARVGFQHRNRVSDTAVRRLVWSDARHWGLIVANLSEAIGSLCVPASIAILRGMPRAGAQLSCPSSAERGAHDRPPSGSAPLGPPRLIGYFPDPVSAPAEGPVQSRTAQYENTSWPPWKLASRAGDAFAATEQARCAEVRAVYGAGVTFQIRIGVPCER